MMTETSMGARVAVIRIPGFSRQPSQTQQNTGQKAAADVRRRNSRADRFHLLKAGGRGFTGGKKVHGPLSGPGRFFSQRKFHQQIPQNAPDERNGGAHRGIEAADAINRVRTHLAYEPAKVSSLLEADGSADRAR